jgi:hypothetical protein
VWLCGRALQVTPQIPALVFRQGVVPAARRIVVVRAGINGAVLNVVVRQMRIVRVAVEGELQHTHAGQLELIPQRRYRRRDDSQVLGQQREPTQSTLRLVEEVGTRTGSPMA